MSALRSSDAFDGGDSLRHSAPFLRTPQRIGRAIMSLRPRRRCRLLCTACLRCGAARSAAESRRRSIRRSRPRSTARSGLPKDRARDDEPPLRARCMEFFGVRPGHDVCSSCSPPAATRPRCSSRAVGPERQGLHAEPGLFYERAGSKAVDERLANNRLPNVVRLDKPLNEHGPRSRIRSTAPLPSWCCTTSSGCRRTCRMCSRTCTRR